MAQVGNIGSNVHANPRAVGGADQVRTKEQQAPPKKDVNPTGAQEDKVKLGGGRPKTIPEASKKIEKEQTRRIERETPAIQAPQQNLGSLNLASQQEPPHPQPATRSAPVDSHSIKSGSKPDTTPRPPTVIQQQIQKAASTEPQPAQQTRTNSKAVQQKEANAQIQVRQEQKQNVNKTERQRNPVAVQTQVGQNINKLT